MLDTAGSPALRSAHRERRRTYSQAFFSRLPETFNRREDHHVLG
jgi:hypothetical protein